MAEICQQEGLTQSLVSGETIRQTVLRLGEAWKRAKQHINRPDPLYQQKNGARPTDRLGKPAA